MLKKLKTLHQNKQKIATNLHTDNFFCPHFTYNLLNKKLPINNNNKTKKSTNKGTFHSTNQTI